MNSEVKSLCFPSPLQFLFSFEKGKVWVKRDDLIHPVISGNKSRKLVGYLVKKPKSIVTFGGAFSNHIHATAYLGYELNIPTVGIIRGEELEDESKHSSTLVDAKSWGMKFHFISREAYRNKQFFLNTLTLADNAIVVPEGGRGELGTIGCHHIIKELVYQLPSNEPVTIIAACGTGTTLAGLIDGAFKNMRDTKIIGIPVLKGDFMEKDIKDLSHHHEQVGWWLDNRFHGGGYAKRSAVFDEAINFARHNYELPLDYVYTAKAFQAMNTLILEKKIQGNVVFYHSGGLQGNR